METNPQIELARRIIEHTDCSLFLTGKAGTGKTTFLHNLLQNSRKRMVVTAPTGIAAINAGGMTLHSFFQLDFGAFIPGERKSKSERRRPGMAFSATKVKIIKGMDVLVIDEISMVRSDLLDAVDAVLRRFRDRSKPFGGVQLLMIGDLQQLPPVVTESERELLESHYETPYFFSSQALRRTEYVTVELKEVYRQTDREFIGLLNAIRDNQLTDGMLEQLNRRYDPKFDIENADGYIRLTTHNRLAAMINDRRMDDLKSEPFIFHAAITGNFPEGSYPVARELVIKKDAQVMFTKNDTSLNKLYFNGMIGTVTRVDEEGIGVVPKGELTEISVPRMVWENIKYGIDEETHEIVEKVEGTFCQYPLKPAWAITIHKSQGLTFDNAIIDASGAFSHGQTYVALSRCRSLEGLRLERPLPRRAIITDRTVTDFMYEQETKMPDSTRVSDMSHRYFLHLVNNLIDFSQIFELTEETDRIMREYFMRSFPSLVTEFSSRTTEMRRTLTGVASRFAEHLRRIDAESGGDESDAHLHERIKAAANYFRDQADELSQLLNMVPEEGDNKDVMKRLEERMAQLRELLNMQRQLLDHFAVNDFSHDEYLDTKAAIIFEKSSGKKRSASKKTTSKTEAVSKSTTAAATEDNRNPVLFDMLKEWRRDKSAESGMPAYTIAHTSVLLGISNLLPHSFDELRSIKGVGATLVKRYGDELLDIVDEFREPQDESLQESTETEEAGEEEIPKRKKSSSKKGESEAETLRLFNAGYEVRQIAEIRQLKESTIMTHLIQQADLSDKQTVDRLVPADRQAILAEYVENTDPIPEKMKEIYEAVGEACTYDDIKIMLRHLRPQTI